MGGLLRRQVLGAAVLLALSALPAWAERPADTLARVLRLDEVAAVLRDEGLAHGANLDRDMLNGHGGTFWAQRVAQIYATDRMADVVTGALADGLSAAQIADCIAFFETGRGQEILSLETSARISMRDPEIEAIARAAYAGLKGSGDARLDSVARFVEVNDLLERNVAGALSSSYQFYRGLVDGGALELDDETILSDVWNDEAETRDDTEGWLYGYLLLAYRPLAGADMQAYIDFSGTPAGQALNAALFDGFDAIYRDISYGLGRSLAQAMAESDL